MMMRESRGGREWSACLCYVADNARNGSFGLMVNVQRERDRHNWFQRDRTCINEHDDTTALAHLTTWG